jgi:aminopeptidase-like protein
MILPDSAWACDPHDVGREIYQFVSRLYPICRSITGEGLRQTLRLVQQRIPLTLHEVPTGTPVFDWTVPKEWNIRDAYVKDSQGKRIIDFRESNLHVVNYSVPVKKKVSLEELKKHLFTLADHPDWIPFRTTYYNENWGFCLSHRQYQELQDEEYEVCIDASLEKGHLTYGEYFLRGESSDEVLISCHACHPSLCNDNLSGVAVGTYLAEFLSRLSLRYSYRFLFIPATIGSITWLSLNEGKASGIKYGLVLTLLGDPGKSTYKRSRLGNTEIDHVVTHVLKHSGGDYKIIDFFPYGYDERQYCSPGFNLPVGCLMRTPHGEFPEYHTSADNLDFVRPEHLADSFSKCLSVFYTLEHDKTYINQNPKCEPQLGKRALYRPIGGQGDGGIDGLSMLWVLNLSDGHHSLLDIAERSGLSFSSIKMTADLLVARGLLEERSK